MKTLEPKVLCQTPTPGKQGVRIAKWKYDALRKAILKVVPKKVEGLIAKDLPEHVKKVLPKNDLEKLGSLSWYTVTVKLELEVNNEIERIPGTRPQRIRRIQ